MAAPISFISKLFGSRLFKFRRKKKPEAEANGPRPRPARGNINILLQQQADLTTAIDTLLDDIAAGIKYMKVYRQMKMYNDPATNPVLYKK